MLPFASCPKFTKQVTLLDEWPLELNFVSESSDYKLLEFNPKREPIGVDQNEIRLLTI